MRVPNKPQNKSDTARLFDAPIPGQSLTMAPGAMPIESAPRFTDLNKAAEYMFDRMTNPKNVLQMKTALENGATAESISKTVTFKGYVDGLWNADMHLMLQKIALAQVVGVAKRAGVKDFQVFSPDKKLASYMAKYAKPSAMTPEDTSNLEQALPEQNPASRAKGILAAGEMTEE